MISSYDPFLKTIVHIDGVYTAGCATSQKAYETALFALFGSLDRLEKILEGKDYLVGNRLTEADIPSELRGGVHKCSTSRKWSELKECVAPTSYSA